MSELLGDVLLQPFRSVEAFLDAGGVVLWGIFSVGIVLWTLILERFWYYWRLYPRARRQWQDEWALRPERRSWAARRVRTAILGEAELELSSTLPIIGNLIAICPLLGLMGTVTGMIQVFDVMALMGTSDARAMASGVSKATVPTMAGMVVGLSGLFFQHRFQSRVRIETEQLSDQLAYR
ncbi:MAG: MotA/TolQ/ExbB proton channel family protein [Panacagrimonas sp.]